MHQKILIAFFILSSGASYGQFNDSTHHRFLYASTGVINTTNDVKSYVLTNRASFEINKKKLAFNTSAGWIYGKQQKKLSNNDLSVFANLDYLKNVQSLYYWGLVGFDDSYSLQINYRFQSGAGIGYTFVKHPGFTLEVSDGFLYETSDLTDATIGKDIYQTVRNSLRIKYKWTFRKILVWEGVQFAQPSLISFKDYILKSTNRLSISLNKWLAINATLDYNRISRTQRENLLFTYGVTVDTYF